MTNTPFQLSGFSIPGGKADPFGMWEVAPVTSGVSFSADVVIGPEEPIHWISFASPEEGLALLDVLQRELTEQQQTLTRLEQRLTQITQVGGGVSFAAAGESAPEFAGAELELDAALQRLTAPVSYGLFDRKQQEAQEADLESTSKWRKFLDQVRDMVVNYARVQTEVAGQPIGQTDVDWTGDFRTIWSPVVTTAAMMLHYHNITVTLQWRLGMIRLVGVVGAGAANIAVKLGVPGGQLLVLPAVWNFVQDALAEWRNLQAIGKQ